MGVGVSRKACVRISKIQNSAFGALLQNSLASGRPFVEMMRACFGGLWSPLT